MYIYIWATRHITWSPCHLSLTVCICIDPKAPNITWYTDDRWPDDRYLQTTFRFTVVGAKSALILVCQNSISTENSDNPTQPSNCRDSGIIFTVLPACPGFTSLVHKVDALVYALALEVNTGDRQQSVSHYGEQVISCLSDQGISPGLRISGEIRSTKHQVPKQLTTGNTGHRPQVMWYLIHESIIWYLT